MFLYLCCVVAMSVGKGGAVRDSDQYFVQQLMARIEERPTIAKKVMHFNLVFPDYDIMDTRIAEDYPDLQTILSYRLPGQEDPDNEPGDDRDNDYIIKGQTMAGGHYRLAALALMDSNLPKHDNIQKDLRQAECTLYANLSPFLVSRVGHDDNKVAHFINLMTPKAILILMNKLYQEYGSPPPCRGIYHCSVLCFVVLFISYKYLCSIAMF